MLKSPLPPTHEEKLNKNPLQILLKDNTVTIGRGLDFFIFDTHLCVRVDCEGALSKISLLCPWFKIDGPITLDPSFFLP